MASLYNRILRRLLPHTGIRAGATLDCNTASQKRELYQETRAQSVQGAILEENQGFHQKPTNQKNQTKNQRAGHLAGAVLGVSWEMMQML